MTPVEEDKSALRSYENSGSLFDSQAIPSDDSQFSRVQLEIHVPGEKTTPSRFSQVKNRMPDLNTRYPIESHTLSPPEKSYVTSVLVKPYPSYFDEPTTTARSHAQEDEDGDSFSKIILKVPTTYTRNTPSHHVPEPDFVYDEHNSFSVPPDAEDAESDTYEDDNETTTENASEEETTEEYDYNEDDDKDTFFDLSDPNSPHEESESPKARLPLESHDLFVVEDNLSRLVPRKSYHEQSMSSSEPPWLPVRDSHDKPPTRDILNEPINAWMQIRSPPRFPADIDLQLGRIAIKPTDNDSIKSDQNKVAFISTVTATKDIGLPWPQATSSTTSPLHEETTPSFTDPRKPCVFPYANVTRDGDDEDESTWLVVGETPGWTFRSASTNECRTPLVVTSGKSGYELSASVMHEAATIGLDRMHYFYNVTEPALYEMGMVLQPGSPGSLSAAFNWQPEESLALTKYAHAALQASTHLHTQPHVFKLHDGRLPTPDASLLRECPLRHDRDCPSDSQRFRTADGSCNNPRHASMGAAFMPYRRLLPPHYRDGVQRLRRAVNGEKLPSARLISMTALRDPVGSADTENGNLVEESPASHLFMQFGQFLDHDLTATPQSFGFNGSVPQCCGQNSVTTLPSHIRHPECLAIRVDASDPYYGPLNVRCLQLVRSAPAPMRDCGLGPRQQINSVTTFLDGSAIYGSTTQRQLELRLFHRGMMNSMPGKQGKPMLPPAPPEEHSLCRLSPKQPCLRAGDLRANEQPALTSMHIIWMREHNRIAEKLRNVNPKWSDERLYQEARRIVVAIFQHITLNEFLPIILGPDVMKVFELNSPHPGYNAELDPTVPNAFASAAFRFGHTLVQDSLTRCNALHRPIPFNKTLHNELALPGIVLNPGAPERLMIGLARQLSRNSDRRISRELTDHLFETKESGPGLDLAAMNIQRGRDHGLPSYNRWRQPCGLRTLETLDDLQFVTTSRYASVLPKLYKHIDDVDLYVGGVAERPVPGGLVGPTFACIIGQTFSDLRLGDRFWYEVQNQPNAFTAAQLVQIQGSNLARILCDNLEGARSVARWPLRASPAIPGNEYFKCGDTAKIPDMTFNDWAEPSDGGLGSLVFAGSVGPNAGGSGGNRPNRPNANPVTQPPNRPNRPNKPNRRPIVKPVNRPGRPGNRPGRPGNRPGRPGNRPGNRPGRPGNRPGNRPNKFGNRPGRPGNRPTRPINLQGNRFPIKIPKPVPVPMPFNKPQVMVINLSKLTRRGRPNKNKRRRTTTTSRPLVEGQRKTANKPILSDAWPSVEIPRPMGGNHEDDP